MAFNEKKEQRKMIALSGFIELFLGFETGGIQLALLLIATEFGINNTTMGSLVTAQAVTTSALPLFLGHLADKKGKKKVLTVFFLVMIGGCLLITVSRTFLLLVAGLLLVGGGYGMLEAIGTAALTDGQMERAERNVSISQGIFSLGAMIGPALCSFLIRITTNWRVVFVATGVEFALLMILLFRVKFLKDIRNAEKASREGTQGAEKKAGRSGFAVFTVLLLLSMMTLSLYTALESGGASFTDAFFQRMIGRADLGTAALSGFWLAMAISRLAFGFINVPARKTITIAFTLSGLTFLSILFVFRPVPLTVLFILAGLFLGPVWPLLFGATMREFPDDSGAASGFLMASAGFGTGIMPVIMGALSDATDIRTAYILPGAFAILGAVLNVVTARHAARKRNARETKREPIG